jgi:dihydroxyacetone kinase-like predicted kinase
VAEQLDALSTKRVVVVPTRTMPEALAALVVYDPESDAELNEAAMSEAIGSVRTGEVTQAVRDAASDVGPVRTGDWIGIVSGDGIVAVGDRVGEVSRALVAGLIGDDGELLTILTGADADPASTSELQTWLADEHADVEVEVHYGGQPLYPYLFGVE